MALQRGAAAWSPEQPATRCTAELLHYRFALRCIAHSPPRFPLCGLLLPRDPYFKQMPKRAAEPPAADEAPKKATAPKKVTPRKEGWRPGDDVIERPTSLEEQSIVEALDVQDLWFPARVVATSANKVLVSFDGWTSDWDEWLPKDSKRLRKHRGWGTPARPDDWQTDSYCLALDMQDKWCRARIMHVSEDSVQVHYQNWASKWDEWIDKISVRNRRPRQRGSLSRRCRASCRRPVRPPRPNCGASHLTSHHIAPRPGRADCASSRTARSRRRWATSTTTCAACARLSVS